MAKKAKKTTSKQAPSESVTKVIRISAKDTVDKTAKAVLVGDESNKSRKKSSVVSPLRSMLGYFKGAWFELKQVRWPSRRATWGLTGAVLVFSAFFVVLILLLDVLFKFIFEQILG